MRASLLMAILLLVQSGLWAAAYRDNWGELTPNGPIDRNTAVVFKSKIFVLETSWDWLDEAYTQAGTLLSSVDGITWARTPLPWHDRLGDVKLVVFQDQLWALIERVDKNLELWHSADAVHWTQESSAAAPASRSEFGVAVFKNKLWITGGLGGTGTLDEIWSSANGTSWTLEAKGDQVAWITRAAHACVVFQDRLWVIGGSDGWTEDRTAFSDAWSSADGRTWTKECEMREARSECSAAVTDYGLMVYGGEAHYSYSSNVFGSCSYGSTTGGLIYTTDGKSWIEAPTPIMGQLQGHSCVVKAGRIFIIGGGHWYDSPYWDHVWWDSSASIWATPDPRYDAAAVAPNLNWRLPRAARQIVTLTMRNTGQAAWQGGATGASLKIYSVPDDTWGEAALTTGTVVAPGATGTFSIPVDLSSLWNPVSLSVQMYHPQAGYFGDRTTITLDFIPDAPLTWREIPLPSDVRGMANPKLVSDGTRLWMNYRYSPDDGVSWIRAAGTVNTPWRPSGLEETATMAFFKGKLWVLAQRSIWSSSDGVTWARIGNAPWQDVERQYYTDGPIHTYTPKVQWCCEHNGELFALIYYDVDEGGDLYYSYVNHLWSSADGVTWKKVGEVNDVHAPGPMLSFGGELWFFGGYLIEGYLDGNRDYYTRRYWYNDVYSSPTGRDWVKSGSIPAADWTLRTVLYRNKVWALQPRGSGDHDVFESDDALNWRPSTNLPCPEGSELLSACVHDDKIWAAFGTPSPTVEGRMYLTSLWCGSAGALTTTVSCTRLDFGRREILTGPSASKNVTVYNHGQAPLVFSGKGLEIISGRPGEFEFAAPPDASPIGPGGARTIPVAYNPALQGPSSATLRISTTDPWLPKYDVRLLGEGFSPLPLRSGDVLAYLLGRSSDPTGLDKNGDGRITIADLMRAKENQIQITWPPQGETLILGTKYGIRWKMDARIARIKLSLARDHLPVRTIAESEPNDGLFYWTAPTDLVPGDNYTILAADVADLATQGESPAWFSLVGEGASFIPAAASRSRAGK